MALTNRRLCTLHALQLDAACFGIAMLPRERLMLIKVPEPIPDKTAF